MDSEYILCKSPSGVRKSFQGNKSLKKIFILLVITVLALAFDGNLAKDIFDYKISSFTDWVLVVLVFAILLSISWANSTKND